MADVGDLRQKAEAAEAQYENLRSLGMSAERMAALDEYEAAFPPSVGLAALRVIALAEQHDHDSREAMEACPLCAALRDFREAK